MIKNHKFCIEERMRKAFGETKIFEFAGYLLEDGSMLNFSHEGHQRDMDHRDVNQFFKNAQGTEVLMKLMRRGNVRVMCGRDSYCFEYIKPLTRAQKNVILEAAENAENLGYPFTLERSDRNGKSIKRYFSRREISKAFAL